MVRESVRVCVCTAWEWEKKDNSETPCRSIAGNPSNESSPQGLYCRLVNSPWDSQRSYRDGLNYDTIKYTEDKLMRWRFLCVNLLLLLPFKMSDQNIFLIFVLLTLSHKMKVLNQTNIYMIFWNILVVNQVHYTYPSEQDIL